MAIKSILFIFGGSQQELAALDTAMMLGVTHKALVRVLHVSFDPSAYAGIYGDGLITSIAIVQAVEKENAERLKRAKHYVVSHAAKHHLPLDEPDSIAHRAAVRFRHRVGLVDATITEEGRLGDLIVIGQEMTNKYDAIAPILFNTGRPVLVVPSDEEEMLNEPQPTTVAFAWNGSLEAGRALYNALPLLKQTEKLYVITAPKHGQTILAEADLLEYLRLHDIKAQGVAVDAKNYHNTGEAILIQANKLDADLLILGAYGHSMFREMVLGGVTQHMLQHSNIPLLLSH